MLNINKILVLILISLFFSGKAIGQRLIVERAESNVLVQRDNLVRAKIEALKDAKNQVILQAVSRFLDFESMITLEPILKKHFLENPDIYIESIRVTREGNTNDFSEFNIQIETQIFQHLILSTFRKLGIPKLKEKIPVRKVILLYNANSALRKKGVFFQFIKNLQIRLDPFRIKAKIINTKDNYLPIESGLPARLNFLPNKNNKDRNGNILALLELKLQLKHKTSKLEKGDLEAKLIFWSQKKGLSNYLDSSSIAEINLPFSVWNEEKIISEILDGLMLKWNPIIQKTIELYKRNGKNLKLNFNGVTGPIEEQVLFKTLFQNNPNWKEINLDKISLNTISYKGIYLGVKKNIFLNYNFSKDVPFKISKKFWKNNQLFIDTKWKELYTNLERYQKDIKGNHLHEKSELKESKTNPILQVPLKKFKQTYILPFESPVLDHIRHRGDSTLFKIDWPLKKEKNKMIIKIHWSRIGISNLEPKITLFNKKKIRIKSYLIGKKKHFTIEHQLTNDNRTIFLKVSDQIGFLEDVAGSYQSFRYVLSVKQN